MRGPYTRNNTPAPHCRHHALVASYSSLAFHSICSESPSSPSRGWFYLYFCLLSSHKHRSLSRVWTTSFNVPLWLCPPMEVQPTVALLLFFFCFFFTLPLLHWRRFHFQNTPTGGGFLYSSSDPSPPSNALPSPSAARLRFNNYFDGLAPQCSLLPLCKLLRGNCVFSLILC